MVGLNEQDIAKTLRNSTHRYTKEMLPDEDANRLSLFVSQGQVYMDIHIDKATKKVRGDVRRGSHFFKTLCATCHGHDGKALNFKTPEKPVYVGTLANDNPWETLHKIRNGQPGVPMIALRVLDVEDQIDILSYAQTLPTK
jgi:mono/diheme cytochrome c family protein